MIVSSLCHGDGMMNLHYPVFRKQETMVTQLVAGRLRLNGFGLEADEPAQVILVPPRRQPLVGHAHLEGSVLSQQVVRDPLQDGHVVGRVTRADAAVILAEGHVQDPVVGVLDAPMRSHRLQPGTGLVGGRLEMKQLTSVTTRSPQRRSHSTQTRLPDRTTPGRGRHGRGRRGRRSSSSGGSRCARRRSSADSTPMWRWPSIR